MAEIVNQNGSERELTLTRDVEGYVEIKVKYLVKLDDGEGPMSALDCPGLPIVGSSYQFKNESNAWATLLPTASVSPHGRADRPYTHMIVEMTYSTKPPSPDKGRCNDTPIEDPLLEPNKLSGSFTRYQEEATTDRFSNPIRTSSHEIIRGNQVEFDKNRSSLKIEQNVADLQYGTMAAMIDTLNDTPMWGLPERCWKMAPPSWERKFYQRCRIYITRILTFESSVHIDEESGIVSSGWDRDLLDEGTKVLNGHWGIAARGEVEKVWYTDFVNGRPPDPRDPNHFIKATGTDGQPCKLILNGGGLPASIVIGIPATIVNTTTIVDGYTGVTLIGQPANGNSRLMVVITDNDNSISAGVVRITGTDTTGAEISERIDISDAGTLSYVTQNSYVTVTEVQVGGDETHTPVSSAIVGSGAGDTIKIQTDASELLAGSIRVEKYTESNFLLLGVPLVLNG